MGLRGEGEQRKAPRPVGVRSLNGTRGQVEVLANGDVSITFILVGYREAAPFEVEPLEAARHCMRTGLHWDQPCWQLQSCGDTCVASSSPHNTATLYILGECEHWLLRVLELG